MERATGETSDLLASATTIPGHGGGHSDEAAERHRRGRARRATVPSARPSAAPTTTSDAWCIWVYTRLDATAAASTNQAGVAGPPARSTAAVNAEVAWPDGKE